MTAPRHAIELVMRGMPADSIHSPYLSSISTQRVLEDDLFEGFPRALIFIGCVPSLLPAITSYSFR